MYNNSHTISNKNKDNVDQSLITTWHISYLYCVNCVTPQSYLMFIKYMSPYTFLLLWRYSMHKSKSLKFLDILFETYDSILWYNKIKILTVMNPSHFNSECKRRNGIYLRLKRRLTGTTLFFMWKKHLFFLSVWDLLPLNLCVQN